MTDFRTKETHEEYEAAKAAGHLTSGTCPLCEKNSLVEYTYWRLIPNKFPYDRIAKTHHMIVPKRHCVEEELTNEEKAELFTLKNTVLNQDYKFLMESLPNKKSIPGHFHLHLLEPIVFE